MVVEKGQRRFREEYDVCVIGSGFGGCFAAWPIVHAGFRVLMLERGGWVSRGKHNWHAGSTVDLGPYYSYETPLYIRYGGNSRVMGQYCCVGGPSVFYGGVSLRYRVKDFQSPFSRDGGGWPFGYEVMAPYYDRVEEILDVAGVDGEDPTEPPRGKAYPQVPPSLSPLSETVASAGRSLGLRPFRLPLAIHYRNDGRRCIECATCDTFACAIEAKNDLATKVLPELMGKGLEIQSRMLVVRLIQKGMRIIGARCLDLETGEWNEYRARVFILAGGALATPVLCLASGLDECNPAGRLIGRFLLRHVNGIVFGFFPSLPEGPERFHKQVAFHDYYFGIGEGRSTLEKLGGIQQVQSPPQELIKKFGPRVLKPFVPSLVKHVTGLLVIAEDEPQFENRVWVDLRRRDHYGLPRVIIEHRYTPRDQAARAYLMDEAQKILKRAGAIFFYRHVIQTFSHALGTLRMGLDEASSPLDPDGRFRHLDNLYVVDGSALPTAAGVNPSLTIAANALRIGETLVKRGEIL